MRLVTLFSKTRKPIFCPVHCCVSIPDGTSGDSGTQGHTFLGHPNTLRWLLSPCSVLVSGKTLSISAFFHDIFYFSSPTQTKILKPGKTVKDFSSSSFFPFSSVAKQECRGVKQIGRKKELFFPSICDMIKRKKKKRKRNTTEKFFMY